MRFGYPFHFYLLLLLPFLGAFMVWSLRARRKALERFAQWPLVDRLTHDVSRRRQQGKAALLLAGFFFSVLALTGPQFGAKSSIAKRRGIDVVIALDVSRSMLAEDVKPNRLERAKHQIGELLDRLEGNRVGLVLFAGRAFVQCPLTLDYGAVRIFLEAADVSAIAVQGTAIADAVRVATRCFDPEDRQHRVIVLFTDGEDHVGKPLEAARAAAKEGVRLFAIGLGTPAGELIPERQGSGEVVYHQDRQGNYVKTHLDERTLEEMALAADGAYYRSTLAGRELDKLCEQIADMEQKEFGSTRFTQYEERFQIPLLLAILCFLAEAFLPEGRSTPQEWKGRFA